MSNDPTAGPELRTVLAPRSPVYRVGHAPDPLVALDWAHAKPDGTFGNRFDDPRGSRDIPPDRRFRVLYLASQPAGAYGETVAQFRPSLKLLASRPPTPAAVGRQQAPRVPRDWRAGRRLGVAVLAPSLRFVDVEDAETVQALWPVFVRIAVALGLPDVGLIPITGSQRRLTQELALHASGHERGATLRRHPLRVAASPRLGVLGHVRRPQRPACAARRADRGR